MAHAPGAPVVLYTREDCSLCEEAEVLLEDLTERYGLDLALVDVDTDPELRYEYGDRVPVGVVEGEEVFELQADARRVEARLAELA